MKPTEITMQIVKNLGNYETCRLEATYTLDENGDLTQSFITARKDIETAIKRCEVYKEIKVPYDMISEYKSVGVEDWRKMGIPPEDEDHDPDLYEPEMY